MNTDKDIPDVHITSDEIRFDSQPLPGVITEWHCDSAGGAYNQLTVIFVVGAVYVEDVVDRA